jgi:hypothetical protein
MAKFHARETADGFTFWNLECISHAEYVEDSESLAITLVDGFTLSLQGQEAADVVEHISNHRFHPYREPTPEQLAEFKAQVKSMGFITEERQNGETE